MCEHFAQNFGDNMLAVASRQRIVSHFLFHQGMFDQKQHDCHPPPTLLSLFPELKIKLKGRHLETTEVIGSESQALLNIPTEHDFQVAFKNCRCTGNGA
jgi:hypothetical protein